MGRKAGIWLRAQDQHWYATIGGQKVKLAADRDEAETLWHTLKTKENAPTLKDRNPFKIVAELFLDRVDAEHPASYQKYRQYLQSFCDFFPDIRVADITATHVQRWLHGQRSWGPTTRHNAVTHLLACLNWAARPENRLIEQNPVAKMSRGQARSRGAETLVDPADYHAVYEAANPALRRVLFALSQTGQRPANLCRITAADCKWDRDLIELGTHKTADKTGRPLLIPMTASLKAMLQDLARQYPEGPLFRTVRGRPYTPHYLANQLGHMQRRRKTPVKLSKPFIAYGMRHTVATGLLEAGVPDAKVAAILGHVNTAMLYRHYGHVRIKSLRDEMERVLNGSGKAEAPPASAGGGKAAPGG
jgi:integrase